MLPYLHIILKPDTSYFIVWHLFCNVEIIVSFLEGLSARDLITNNIPPLLYWKAKLCRLKIKTKQKNLTMSFCNEDGSQNSIFFASASDIQNNGVWGWREKLQLLFYFIFIILQYFYLLYPPYLARFLCLVNFSLNSFFSLHLAIATTLALIFITYQLGYYSPPLLVFLISPSPVS